MKFFLAFFILLLSTSVFAQATPSAKQLISAQIEQAKHITPTELNSELQKNRTIILIDVRQTSERAILGAISKDDLSIPRGYLEIKTYKKIPELEAPIVVFCGKGIRSAFAANTLSELGYKNVRNLKGGVKAWINAGLPTIDPE